MGRSLDPTRQTRFPPTRTADTRSQQTNLRELEDAILFLQETVTDLKTELDSAKSSLAEATARLAALEEDEENG